MMTKTEDKIYKAWWAMKDRCNNPYSSMYKHYGGRGITVCKEWEESFHNFLEWSLENGYRSDLSIDRIDNNKGYSPGNCRWATWKEQSRNRRCNRLITYNGETKCVSEWAEELGITHSMILQRLNKGWPIEKVFNPDHQKVFKADGQYSKDRLITYNGKTQTLSEWSEETGVSMLSLQMRIRKRIRKGKDISNLFDKDFGRGVWEKNDSNTEHDA